MGSTLLGDIIAPPLGMILSSFLSGIVFFLEDESLLAVSACHLHIPLENQIFGRPSKP